MSGRRETPDDAGVGRSYGDLYVEYAPAARGLALSMVPPDVADDIVAEAFARVLAAIRAGGGPDHAFRPYLLAAVRNLANDWIAARRRVTVIGDLDEEADDRSAPLISGFSGDAATEAEARAEARLIVRAFSRLPKRWRAVLWQLEVEGKAPAEVAPVFGLSGNGVSALAMRAREGLRQAYLQEHIGTNIPASCRAYAEDLGAGTRGRLSPRRQAAMQDHLGHCPACQDLFTELSELNRKLGTILAPIVLAGTSAALHGGRHVLRTGLAAHWRAMRWHPVTAATGAAASVAVAGGMLFAVNVTPLPATPSHVTVRAADPAANSGSPAGHHAGDRRGGGGGGGGAGGGGGGTLTGSGTPVGGVSAAAAGPLPGPASLTGTAPVTGAAPVTGTAPLTGAGSPAGTVGGAVTGLTGTVNGTVGSLADTAAATVTGATSTVVTTVTGITGTVGTTVNGLANTAAAAVTGVTGSALATVSGVTGTV
ncbi:MAG TPA: sigma-70 family RNA polymerase sigma factor, partial [Streptosporangiaceae bacterium]|nr:sigma-70 family RNA polymerase sigma factor [Streptosporangiaceae bacterium]